MSFAAPVSRVKQWHRLVALGMVLTPIAASGQAAAQTLPLTARTKGSANAPVTVYEMADFQCPVCGRFVSEIWPTIEKEYIATGKVKWIYIMFPLTQIHANAAAAAEFATCAALEGKFWQAHDMLYANQENWSALKNPAPFFQSKIGSLGLKADAMTSCLTTGIGRAMVADDASGSERSGARGTPTFYIEGGLMDRLYPIEVFRKVLDSIWAAKTKKS